MTDQLKETRERGEGALDEAKGRGKQAWGELTDNEQSQDEGQVDETKGKAKQAWSDVKEKAGDLKDQVSE
jgi:uncharacterized protein YjbJ (UPF0337 family)